LGEFGGIVEGVEVDIGEKEGGDGCGRAGGGLCGCGEGGERKESEEGQEKGLHGTGPRGVAAGDF
jgi:hypothetical protein